MGAGASSTKKRSSSSPADLKGSAKPTELKRHSSEQAVEKMILGSLKQDDDFRSKLDKILISRPDRTVFGLFLKDEYASEMLGFWRAADVYQVHALKFAALSKTTQTRLDEVSLTHEHILRVAQIIYDHYVQPGAPEQVNLSQKMTRTIKKQIASGSVTSELFADAIGEVKKCLAQDKLPRFKTWVKKIESIQQLMEKCALDGEGHIVTGQFEGAESIGTLLENLSTGSAALGALNQQRRRSSRFRAELTPRRVSPFRLNINEDQCLEGFPSPALVSRGVPSPARIRRGGLQEAVEEAGAPAPSRKIIITE